MKGFFMATPLKFQAPNVNLSVDFRQCLDSEHKQIFDDFTEPYQGLCLFCRYGGSSLMNPNDVVDAVHQGKLMFRPGTYNAINQV